MYVFREASFCQNGWIFGKRQTGVSTKIWTKIWSQSDHQLFISATVPHWLFKCFGYLWVLLKCDQHLIPIIDFLSVQPYPTNCSTSDKTFPSSSLPPPLPTTCSLSILSICIIHIIVIVIVIVNCKLEELCKLSSLFLLLFQPLVASHFFNLHHPFCCQSWSPQSPWILCFFLFQTLVAFHFFCHP